MRLTILSLFVQDFVPNTRKATKEELPPKFVDGEVLETYSVDVDHCLEYLVKEFALNGGRITRKTVWFALDSCRPMSHDSLTPLAGAGQFNRGGV